MMFLISLSAFAESFSVTGNETLYYYQPNTSGAAEAKMWISALAICNKGDSESNILPIRISKVTTSINKATSIVTAKAVFKCLSAEGNEI